MSEVLTRSDPVLVLDRVHAALDELADLDLTGSSDDGLLDYWRELERVRRRLPSVEHGLVLEAQGRSLPETLQVRSVARLLRRLLRLDPGEATARVRAAEAAGAWIPPRWIGPTQSPRYNHLHTQHPRPESAARAPARPIRGRLRDRRIRPVDKSEAGG